MDDIIADMDDQEKQSGNESDTGTELERDGWIDLLGNGQLLRKIVKESENEEIKPRFRGQVTVRYDGYLNDFDGHKVDCDTKTIVLGFSNLISAVEMCVQAMHVGEIDHLKTGPRFGFGKLGREPDIPGDANLIYEIELVHINDDFNLDDMNPAQWIEFADQRKERGNYFYRRQEYDKAVDVYNKILMAIEPVIDGNSGDNKEQLKDCLCNLYNNMAASQLKLDDHEPCLKSCEKVLSIDSENHKALYRKGKVLMAKNELEGACKAFQAAANIEQSSLIQMELNTVRLKLTKQADREKALYSKMLEVEPPKRARKTLVIGRGLLVGSLLATFISVALFFLFPKLNSDTQSD